MSNGKSRRRVRVKPLPAKDTDLRELGVFQNWNPATKTWNPPNPGDHYKVSWGIGYPGIEAEATWDETHGAPPYKSGGPFKRIKIISCQPFGASLYRGTFFKLDGSRKYTGGFNMPDTVGWGGGMVISPYTTTLSNSSPLFPTMSGIGDKAWSATKPKLEKAGAAVFLAELRDLPGMLKTTSKGFHDIWNGLSKPSSAIGFSSWKPEASRWQMQPKAAADQFLNHQFGWKPFLSDMNKFIDTYHDTAKIIQGLSDENGQWVRRRATLKSDTVTTIYGQGTGIPGWLFPDATFNSGWLTGPATYSLRDEVTTNVYGVGKFRYYRPEFDRELPDYLSTLNAVKRRMTIYGLRVSPSNIYKATPWTWAIDWISNVGTYVDRVNDILVDSIAAQYFYCCQSVYVKRVWEVSLPFNTGTVHLKFQRIIDTKERVEGTGPFGFNLTLANLTPRQIAIAGALGITRLG
jgi:hypothetical protein